MRAEVDAGQDGRNDGAEDDSVERIPMLATDAAENACERRGVVACQGPENAAGGEVAAEQSDQVGEDGDDEEAEGSAC